MPSIDTFDGGVSIEIYGRKKYLKLLRYPEHEKPKIDDAWFVKENESFKHLADKLNISVELLAGLKEYLQQPRTRVQLQEFCDIKSRIYFRKTILNPLLNAKKIKYTDSERPKSSKQKYVWNNQ